MDHASTTHRIPGVKAVARRRPSYGKGRFRTLVRGGLELAWGVGVLAGTAYLDGLPEPERSQTFGQVVDGGSLHAVAFGVLLASAPLFCLIGAYRIVAAVLDLCWPRRTVAGAVVDRGTVEGGPWTPTSLAPLVGWRRADTMRWVAILDDETRRVRTLHVRSRDRWLAAAPGARVRVRTSGILRHVRAVEVTTPAPPLVAAAPFAGPWVPPAPAAGPAAVAGPGLHHELAPIRR